MRSYVGFVRDRSGGLISVRFRRFYLGGCALNTSITPYFAFLSVFYSLSVYFYRGCIKTFLNLFYNVLLELVLALAVSGAGSVLPKLFPGYPWRAVLLALYLALVFPDHVGRCGFHEFPVVVCH